VTTTSDWPIIEPDIETVLAHCERPLDELAAGTIPAIVIRNAWSVESCQRLIDRLVADELLYDRTKPIPDKFLKHSIPEGYYREGTQAEATRAWESAPRVGKNRIDIGTSLGYRGSDQDAFLTHANETRELFSKLFEAGNSPVELMYDCLSRLSSGKRAVTAYEPDGREYGPAIIRAHYGGYTYAPHFDSVRLREKRENYAVHEFEHQFAGVLVLQNTSLADVTAQCRLHRCLWTEEVDPALRANSFHEFAAERQIPSVEVCLEPGDLYFFNTRSIHEVPGVAGELPRIVLATFIGYSSDRDEIFVWS
jgi:hypothetical protein